MENPSQVLIEAYEVVMDVVGYGLKIIPHPEERKMLVLGEHRFQGGMLKAIRGRRRGKGFLIVRPNALARRLKAASLVLIGQRLKLERLGTGFGLETLWLSGERLLVLSLILRRRRLVSVRLL